METPKKLVYLEANVAGCGFKTEGYRDGAQNSCFPLRKPFQGVSGGLKFSETLSHSAESNAKLPFCILSLGDVNSLRAFRKQAEGTHRSLGTGELGAACGSRRWCFESGPLFLSRWLGARL